MVKEGQKASLAQGILQPCHFESTSGSAQGSACLNTAWHLFEALGYELRYT